MKDIIQYIEKITQTDFDNEVIEIRSQKKGSKEMQSHFFNDLESLEYKLQSLLANHNIFFGVAPRKNNTSGKKENCSSISSFWVDIDCGEDDNKIFTTKEEGLKFIENAPIKPSLIIDSGNGIHLYFFFGEKIYLDSEGIEYVEKINRELRFLFGGDSVHNVDRIMRIPGTFNLKTDEPKKVRVHSYDDIIYDRMKLASLLTTRWDEIRKLELKGFPIYPMLFGKNLEVLETNDRSAIDQMIIVKLISAGFTPDEVEELFDHLPVSGKILDHQSPKSYIQHSISNAQKYLNDEFLKNNENNSIRKTYYELINKDTVGICNQHHKLMTNFVLKINIITKCYRDGVAFSYLDGIVHFPGDISHNFNNIGVDILYDGRALTKFLHNLAPTKVEFYTKIQYCLEAINYLNRDAEVIEEKEFGYNKKLTEYITGDSTISSSEFLNKRTPIKYSEIWGKNSLKFNIVKRDELAVLKRNIVQNLVPWDLAEITLSALSFTLLPVLHPFLRDSIPNKFYLMLRGASGSGKTHLAKICQNFYGNFNNLVSWTSTDTSINIIGNAFKDSLFVVDDFKIQNFKNENAVKNAMAIIQNYSDGTGRQRANVDLAIKDERFIKGWLMISAEDVVFTETSTIARGIIIPINSKEYKPKEAANLLELSKQFNSFTPYYIQHVISELNQRKILSKLNENIELFSSKAVSNPEISLDNLSRVINNFALLKTSWDFLSFYLVEDEISRDQFNKLYIEKILQLFVDNIDRVTQAKPEMLFEHTLWSMVDAQKLYFEKLALRNDDDKIWSYKGVKIGEFYPFKDDVRICINLKTALREVTKNNPEVQISFEALKDKLYKSGKIEFNKSEKVFFAEGKHGRGFKWTGDFPKSSLGLYDSENPEKENEQIINTPLEEDDFLSEVSAKEKNKNQMDDFPFGTIKAKNESEEENFLY